MATGKLIFVVGGNLNQIQAGDTGYISNLDTAAAGALAIGAANATSLALANNNTVTSISMGTGSGVTSMNILTGATGACTLNLATAAGMTGVNIGTGMGSGDTITLGGASSTTAVAGNATVAGTTTCTGMLYANGDIGRTSAGTLVVGNNQCTTINVGSDNATTSMNIGTSTALTSMNIGTNITGNINIGKTAQTVYILGNLDVAGTETVHSTATMMGDVNIGDNAADTCTFNGAITFDTSAPENGRFIADIPFGSNAGSTRSVMIQQSAAAANGTSLQLVAGAPGAGAGTTGGSVYLIPTTGTTAWGHTRVGATTEVSEADSVTAQELLFNTGNATPAGFRYNTSTNKIQFRYNSGAWADLVAATVNAGTDDGEVLLWNSGSSAWVASDDLSLSLGAGDRLINPRTNTGGAGKALRIAGGNGTGAVGGDLSLRGGSGTTSGVVYLGDSNTLNVTFGAGTDGARFTVSTNTLAPLGAGIITANNLTSLFSINSIATSANVTAANLNTLTAGSSSDASALHYHLTGTGVGTLQGTVGATALVAGAPVGMSIDGSNNPRLYACDASQDIAATRTPWCQGIATAAALAGSTATLATTGEATAANAVWGSGTVPAATLVGQPVFVDPANVGKYTMTAPSTAGQWRIRVGYLTFSDGTTTARFAIQIGEPIKL